MGGLNKSVSTIESFVHQIKSKSPCNDSLPLHYYQALPKMICIIQSIQEWRVQIKMLTALDLNVPNYAGSDDESTQIKTLTGISRVLLLHYFFPKGEYEK